MPLAEAQLDAALSLSWAEGLPVATLLGLDAARWVARHPAPAMRAWCRALLPAVAPASPTATPAAPVIMDKTALRRALTAIVAEVTGAAAASIEADRPLRELGVDSVMTLRIRDRIAERLGREVRITAFWSYPTIATFAGHLAETAPSIAAPAPPSAPTVAPTAVSDDIVAALADKWAKYL